MRSRSWAFLPLVLAGLYLAVRSWGAAGDVLGRTSWETPAPGTEQVPMVEAARERDTRLSEVAAPERDPFRAPPAPRRAAPVRTTPKPPPEPTPPEVRLILFDQVRPATQISVDGAVSEILHVGQSFRGWTVESISESQVVVSRDGKSFPLTLRR